MRGRRQWRGEHRLGGGGLERAGAGCAGACATTPAMTLVEKRKPYLRFSTNVACGRRGRSRIPIKNLHSTPTPSKNPSRGALSMLCMHGAPGLDAGGEVGVLCSI